MTDRIDLDEIERMARDDSDVCLTKQEAEALVRAVKAAMAFMYECESEGQFKSVKPIKRLDDELKPFRKEGE